MPSPVIDLSSYQISVTDIRHNASPAQLYEDALTEKGTAISSTGALMTRSGEKTGRSPLDKRIAEHSESRDDVWWGDVNVAINEESFAINRQRAVDYLNSRDRLFIVDGFAGWDVDCRIKVRIICESAYHALFMHNMLIRPSQDELATFGEPDYAIFNAGQFPADERTPDVTSETSVSLSFEQREFVILGTGYAGEMKKGIFTIMNYLMPKRGILSMHCSANEGGPDDVSLFFGLSGTGKTTLSADPSRALIGDDEHCWTDTGVFNIEGGCYAKAIRLSATSEPEIYRAIRFGAVLENVVYDPATHAVDFDDSSITENTRVAYPIEFIDNAKTPCLGNHPKNIILLTCDAFGVLPPVSRLSPAQAMYHFMSGYTAKVAGTEMGVTEPTATFSACFGAAFLVWHPTVYAELLAAKIREHGANVWMVNTGWTGGGYGTGNRIDLAHTRAIIDAIHDGTLVEVETVRDPVFGVDVCTQCAGVPDEMLIPRQSWEDKAAFDAAAAKLAHLFKENFEQYTTAASDEILAAAPNPAGTSTERMVG